MIGHRIMGTSLLFAGDVAEARAHYDRAIALYGGAAHRPLATQLGDVEGAILSYRAWALWLLGYPNAALADAGPAIGDARKSRWDMHFRPVSTAEIMRQQTPKPMNLSLWRTKRAPCYGRRPEC